MSVKKPKTKVDEFKDALKAKKEAEEKKSGDKELKTKIKELEEKLREGKDRLLRTVAEADNFKKRLEKEHAELTKYGHEKLVGDLISILDDLDRVLDHCPHEAIPEVKSFVEGVELINKQFRTTLGKFGLSEINALGEKFDPNLHEGISTLPSDEYPADAVMAVHRKGYKLNDRLLRASMVSVSQGPDENKEDELTEKINLLK
ncbi:nucleotide exchange factor GrpE [bacterium]|nr:nucleotide exchange factor GrpE [bacterium]